MAAVICGTLSAADAHAWGAEGHQLIAQLAEQHLTPSASAEVRRLLALEPSATLASVSTWADKVRGPGTAALHYVNLPEGVCTYNRERDCPDGRCVVEAINAKLDILRSRAPDAARLAALKWVVHLVGDIHQPLHVGLARDKGGNLFQVQAFGRGSNLHKVWDSELLARFRAYGGRMPLNEAAPALRARELEPAAWAVESCQASRADGFYPADRNIGQAYLYRWQGLLAQRLSLASRRLAEVINEAMRAD